VLRHLAVKNLAVLAGGEAELGPGLNVLTGETGAGKSLVVDSLALLAGGRAASELVREGAESLSVVGVFDAGPGIAERLAEAGIDPEDDQLVVRRDIEREGRNRVFVNDQPATARLLQALAPYLLRIHGQREELGLAEPELQRTWLDRSGGAEAPPLLAAVAAAFDELRTQQERLERLTGDERLRRERVDLLRFQIEELSSARLREGEEEELRRERDGLRHHEAIVRSLDRAQAELVDEEGAAQDRLGAAARALEEIADWEPLAGELGGELDELVARVSEVGRQVAHRLSGLEHDPSRLDEVESRLALLERLLRKHGGTSAAALERLASARAELAELEGGEERKAEVEVALGRAVELYREAATVLSKARARWASELARRTESELAELALEKARFDVVLETARLGDSPLRVAGEGVEFGPEGFDRVVFRFAANPGEPPQALVRVASGGELARVALALQLASRGAEVEGGPTLVFDEIDAGLGGAEGAAIGRKLRRLARHGQILAVTHLPQVASCADRHFRVGKQVRGGRTYAEVGALDEASRVEEIARMLSAEKITAASRRHAEELLAGAAGDGA